MNMQAYINILTANTQAPEASASATLFMTFFPFVLLIGVFYFLIIRPQKKQEKRDKEMRDNLEIGDEIVTNGGIVGLVTQIKDDTLVIETGGNRTRIRIKKWAIAQIVTEKDDVES